MVAYGRVSIAMLSEAERLGKCSFNVQFATNSWKRCFCSELYSCGTNCFVRGSRTSPLACLSLLEHDSGCNSSAPSSRRSVAGVVLPFHSPQPASHRGLMPFLLGSRWPDLGKGVLHGVDGVGILTRHFGAILMTRCVENVCVQDARFGDSDYSQICRSSVRTCQLSESEFEQCVEGYTFWQKANRQMT